MVSGRAPDRCIRKLYHALSLVLTHHRFNAHLSVLHMQPPKHNIFSDILCAVFLLDLGECNNSNYSLLLYKVTVREAWQGTIFPDRLLICHSYCCGYCMTVHVLSSSSLLTFMFHLIMLLFLGFYDIKILSCCLFKCGASRPEFSGLSSVSDSTGKGSTRVHMQKKVVSTSKHKNSFLSLSLFFS